jgi:hypothetical protein
LPVAPELLFASLMDMTIRDPFLRCIYGTSCGLLSFFGVYIPIL